MTTNEPAALTLVVPEAERRVYARARTLLVRKMKAQAPELGELILHELRLRRSQLIAEEYLDTTRWHERERRMTLSASDELPRTGPRRKIRPEEARARRGLRVPPRACYGRINH
ncbi:hypothetical protein OpiT1DRAFT_03803 [Opitutaceae bacterium TAV1]|nr:hypothetical protein OpiT1DRAFT_03803 [Opitutaceae bacterium TAV1]